MKIILKTFSLLLLTLIASCASAPDRPVPSLLHHEPPSISKADLKRHTVIDTVQKMLGVRYRYGGSTPKGFDCSGLVWYAHKKAGLKVPRTAKLQMSGVRSKRMSRIQAGDLVFFKTGWGASYHVGTYIGAGLFVHAPSAGKKVSTASLDNPYWKKRLKRVGTFY